MQFRHALPSKFHLLGQDLDPQSRAIILPRLTPPDIPKSVRGSSIEFLVKFWIFYAEISIFLSSHPMNKYIFSRA